MDAERNILEIEKTIQRSGYKMTRSRIAMVREFIKSESHLRVEDIQRLMEPYGISVPTIYRNISIFKRIGILKEITMQDDKYYELHLLDNKMLHIHFKCRRCGRIKEYRDAGVFQEMIRQQRYIEEQYHDQVEDITIVMSGLCNLCKQQQ